MISNSKTLTLPLYDVVEEERIGLRNKEFHLAQTHWVTWVI